MQENVEVVEELNSMAIDPETQKRLDKQDDKIEEIEEKLDRQGERIINLETDFAVMESRLVSIEQGQQRMESLYLQGNNLIHNLLLTQNQEMTRISTALIDANVKKDENKTSENNNKNDNRSKIIIGILGFLGTAGAYLFGKNN